MATKHFRSNEAYRKYVAYEHIHHLNKTRGPYPEVIIAGHHHRVNHCTLGLCGHRHHRR